jgi:hypothetical protein
MVFLRNGNDIRHPEKKIAAKSSRFKGFHWLREQDLNLRSIGHIDGCSSSGGGLTASDQITPAMSIINTTETLINGGRW